jgi:hypothetical protein
MDQYLLPSAEDPKQRIHFFLDSISTFDKAANAALARIMREKDLYGSSCSTFVAHTYIVNTYRYSCDNGFRAQKEVAAYIAARKEATKVGF